MEDREITDLLERYYQGNCTEKEQALIESWYNMQAGIAQQPEGQVDYDRLKALHWKRINGRLPRIPYRLLIAAVLISGLLTIMLFFRTHVNIFREHPGITDVSPGQDLAILTLSDGRKITLDSATAGSLTADKGFSIARAKDGSLVYQIKAESKDQVLKNTLTTPRGGQFQLQLPDGSKVWLNAATSLSYEMGGGSGKRYITLSGEAYFEVAKDRLHPFIVKTEKQNITVLGTHFNVDAYTDQRETATTLYEGSVAVATSTENKKIVPGEKALSGKHGSAIELKKADDKSGPSWKLGWISFDGESLESILKKASRWYDIDVVYPLGAPQESFTGGISRKSNLSALLKVLQSNGIGYTLEEKNKRKTLTILPTEK